MTSTREQLHAIFTAFTPTSSLDTRADGYRVLAKLSETHLGQLRGPVTSLVEDAFRAATQADALAAISFLTALFQTDNVPAGTVLVDEGVFESVSEARELYPDDTTAHAIAALLSQASAHKACREPVSLRYLSWLRQSTEQARDVRLRAAAACAIVKLYVGDAEEQRSDEQTGTLVTLINNVLTAVSNDKVDSAISDVVEALAYLSAEPAAKHALTRDAAARALSFIPAKPKHDHPLPAPVLYGVSAFVRNLVAGTPQRTEEEEQLAKLRGMTREGAQRTSAGRMQPPAPDPRDAPEAVRARCGLLIGAGAVATLGNIARLAHDSPRIGRLIGEALLWLVDEKSDRGRVLQAGGAKTLLSITRDAYAGVDATKETPSRAFGAVDVADLRAPQALAKLAITSPPVAVFGPGDSGALNALRPLSALLLHHAATRLQNFEGLMALTNLASASSVLAERVATAPGVAGILESFLLDDHQLVRRAAAELTCNLLAGSLTAAERVASSPNRVQVLLALADADDAPTRSAAAGALACVAHDVRAAQAIAARPAHVARLLTSGDDALLHRGSIVALGALEGLSPEKSAFFVRALHTEGASPALVAIVQRGSAAGPLLEPAVALLKIFSSLGILVQS